MTLITSLVQALRGFLTKTSFGRVLMMSLSFTSSANWVDEGDPELGDITAVIKLVRRFKDDLLGANVKTLPNKLLLKSALLMDKKLRSPVIFIEAMSIMEIFDSNSELVRNCHKNSQNIATVLQSLILIS